MLKENQRLSKRKTCFSLGDVVFSISDFVSARLLGRFGDDRVEFSGEGAFTWQLSQVRFCER